MLRFCCLGSGSAGNALVVEAVDGTCVTRVLLDDGFGGRELARRLGRAGLRLDDLDAVVLTHEHSDHVAGVRSLLGRCRLPVFCSEGTARAASLDGHCTQVVAGEIVTVGALTLVPYEVAHDAAEPLQFLFTDGDRRLGVLTDVGAPTPSVFDVLGGAHALLLECNHDVDLLRASAYPPFLKARILGGRGHLSNAQAAQLVAGLDRSRLGLIVAAHLSERNNRPELARAALSAVVGVNAGEIGVADQAEGLSWQRC